MKKEEKILQQKLASIIEDQWSSAIRQYPLISLILLNFDSNKRNELQTIIKEANPSFPQIEGWIIPKQQIERMHEISAKISHCFKMLGRDLSQGPFEDDGPFIRFNNCIKNSF